MTPNRLIKELAIDGQNKSTFIMMYSAIEYFMIKLCDVLKNRVLTKINLEDLSSKGYIGTCFLFFDKVIELEYDNKKYDKFKKFQLIRNIIIHNNSSFSGRDKKTISETLNIYKNSILKENGRFVFINSDFVEDFLQTSKNLLESLESNIEKKFNFPSLLLKLDNQLRSSKICRKNGNVKVDDGRIIYEAIISDEKKMKFGKLIITFEPSQKSINHLIIQKEHEFVTKEEIKEYYKRRKTGVKECFKKYRKLINGKRNFKYEMIIL